jgi:hypothetical protein
MSDEPAKIILGDTAISAFEGTPGRRRFGRGKDTGPSLTHCENCGAELQGHWCAQCGQPAIEYRRSFRYVVADLLNEFLNWDSKFFTTIALLILKPWRLTNEFLAGKRVRYVNPLRLYLLASILFFFAVNFGAKGIRFDPTKFPEEKRAEVAAAIADKRSEIEAELSKDNLTPEQRQKVQKALDYLTKPTSSATTTPTPEQTQSPHRRQAHRRRPNRVSKPTVQSAIGRSSFLTMRNPPRRLNAGSKLGRKRRWVNTERKWGFLSAPSSATCPT